MELKELYQEIILDHGKNPRNLGKCMNYNYDAKVHNPLCGDKVHIYIKLDNENKLQSLFVLGFQLYLWNYFFLIYLTHTPLFHSHDLKYF